MASRCLIILATLGLCVAFADAGGELDPRSARDVIIGTVKEVSTEKATNGNPAKVTVEITQTLKGNLKGTVVAIWSGRSHGVDTGEIHKNPAVIQWAAEISEKPKLGDTYILFGMLYEQKDKDGRESQLFYTRPGGRLPLTDENRSKAIENIKTTDLLIKVEMERRAAADALHLANVKKWRAGMTDKRLAAAINDVDFVGLGTLSSYQIPENIYTFSVKEVLKGRRRDKASADQPYYLQLRLNKEVASLIDRESQYLLVLSEKGLMLHPSVLVYQQVGDDVVLADADTIKLARELTKNLAGKAPPAILIYPDDPALAAALEVAAGRKLTVIRGWIFGIGVEMDKIAKVSSITPEYYLRVTRSKDKGPAKIKLELAQSSATHTLVMDATLIHPDTSALTDQAADIIATILKAK